MSVSTFKTVFPKTLFAELNKYIKKKVRWCVYKNSSIPQLDISMVIIKHKDIELPWCFS